MFSLYVKTVLYVVVNEIHIGCILLEINYQVDIIYKL